ncbi:MAG: hypothetical protein APF77_23785 [Clostridia bacterium BRH_c25]|nr:MAG: hypothetical protein APF77_23785 [Clostridia bacterium BRH_c25]
MKSNITDKERFVLLVLSSLLVLLYFYFGIFQSTTINPIIKTGPFLIMSFYVFIRTYFHIKKKKRD